MVGAAKEAGPRSSQGSGLPLQDARPSLLRIHSEVGFVGRKWSQSRVSQGKGASKRHSSVVSLQLCLQLPA